MFSTYPWKISSVLSHLTWTQQNRVELCFSSAFPAGTFLGGMANSCETFSMNCSLDPFPFAFPHNFVRPGFEINFCSHKFPTVMPKKFFRRSEIFTPSFRFLVGSNTALLAIWGFDGFFGSGGGEEEAISGTRSSSSSSYHDASGSRKHNGKQHGVHHAKVHAAIQHVITPRHWITRGIMWRLFTTR